MLVSLFHASQVRSKFSLFPKRSHWQRASTYESNHNLIPNLWNDSFTTFQFTMGRQTSRIENQRRGRRKKRMAPETMAYTNKIPDSSYSKQCPLGPFRYPGESLAQFTSRKNAPSNQVSMLCHASNTRLSL